MAKTLHTQPTYLLLLSCGVCDRGARCIHVCFSLTTSTDFGITYANRGELLDYIRKVRLPHSVECVCVCVCMCVCVECVRVYVLYICVLCVCACMHSCVVCEVLYMCVYVMCASTSRCMVWYVCDLKHCFSLLCSLLRLAALTRQARGSTQLRL